MLLLECSVGMVVYVDAAASANARVVRDSLSENGRRWSWSWCSRGYWRCCSSCSRSSCVARASACVHGSSSTT
ncbi:hypothetical protein B0T17DRAFT_543315 [Bombardia bombarda]|uniref:Uncharacterized protein n=1 Tax=Bombardia bombarda TaxID=252184 RepID=A0AA39WCZ9_9PEZI|nr:hypothetical protein B0T17DRAFT_543315 [Bombardia bombarda]